MRSSVVALVVVTISLLDSVFTLPPRPKPGPSCNIASYNNASTSCLSKWLAATNFPKLLGDAQISDVVKDVMKGNEMDVPAIQDGFRGTFGNKVANPLGKFIDAMGIIEPSLVYLVADLVEVLNITADDLARLGIEGLPVDREGLIQMYTKYFELNCKKGLLWPLLDCEQEWMEENCKAKDDWEEVLAFKKSMGSSYCIVKGQTPAFNDTLKDELASCFGTVTKDAVEEFGIVRNESSPFLFNLPIGDNMPESCANFSQKLMEDCNPLYEKAKDKLDSLMSGESTVGIGKAFPQVFKLIEPIGQCAVKSAREFHPKLVSKDSKLHKAIAWIVYRWTGMKFDPRLTSAPKHHESILQK